MLINKKGRLEIKMLKAIIEAIMILVMMLSGCTASGKDDGVDTSQAVYTQITQEKAKEMMKADDGHVIVDVRRQDEYDEGHIPGAILIPNESIEDTRPDALPDLEQIILVYCRSGRRSKEAAQKLADMGYKNVYEFGGIIDWTGDVVKNDIENRMDPVAIPGLRIGDRYYSIDLENNSSAEAFLEKIKKNPLTVDMQDYGSFEKVGDLPWSLPTNDEKITTKPGDIILYQGNKITIYYDENTWNFTKLGSINGVTGEELKEALGDGDVTVEFFVEWTE